MSLSLTPPQRRSAAASRLSLYSTKNASPLRPTSFFPPYASQRPPTFPAPQTHIVLPKNWPNSRHASASLKGCGYRVRAYPSDGAVRGEGTAALAQKNSEATRALAMQEDILEKELGEIQKVLLAMQDQQQKQLELILAIGKTGKLWESRRAPNPEHTNESASLAEEDLKQLESTKLKPL